MSGRVHVIIQIGIVGCVAPSVVAAAVVAGEDVPVVALVDSEIPTDVASESPVGLGEAFCCVVAAVVSSEL